ncbi:MAG: UDP-N-acetylmuramate--L-alanine ligase [Thermoanaerobaculia bacterium]
MMFLRFGNLHRVHMVGVGGAGMSGIAEVLLAQGLEVSGSDLVAGEVTGRLEAAGLAFWQGHEAAHVEGADIVVVSSAVPADNPERLRARELGLPVVRRAEMLGELMRLKYGIAVAGTHGKTTTTSLVGHLLTEAGFDPTVIVGGRLRVSGTGARLGRSDYLVAEADEYDRSFLRLAPILAVITNIDVDHLDTYRDLSAIKRAFVEFAERVPFFGQVVVCLDDPNVQSLLPELADRRVVTYGLSPQATLRATDLTAEPGRQGFTVVHAERGELGRLEIPMPGEHNVRNALAAIGVGLAMDVELDVVAAALARFGGVHRRFERLGSWRGAAVIDDYAHHPTEVTATLQAARQVFRSAGIHAVFQPHLYSRTQALGRELGQALLGADHAIVTDIYRSREQPIEGVSAEIVVDAARASGHRHVAYCPRWQEAPALLESAVSDGDVVVTLGAGDIYKLAVELAGRGEGS